MKLRYLLIPLLSGAIFSSCSDIIYEDLKPCPQGVNLLLTYCNNISGDDKYDEQVHCSKVLIYNDKLEYFGAHDLEGNSMSLDLVPGNYHAIAYGGMSCDFADFDFSHDVNAPHDYNELLTYLLGTRAPESAKDLHDHFHGVGDFTISEEDMEFINHTIDLTKNTNRFKVQLVYTDGSAIKSDDFRFSITADNAVTDHANNVVPQGEDVTYRPHTLTPAPGASAPAVVADMTIARLTPESNATLHITKANGDKVIDLPLIKYLEKIYKDDLPGATLREYLDRQDSWTLQFAVDPESDLFLALTIKINDWTVVINSFDL